MSATVRNDERIIQSSNTFPPSETSVLTKGYTPPIHKNLDSRRDSKSNSSLNVSARASALNSLPSFGSSIQADNSAQGSRSSLQESNNQKDSDKMRSDSNSTFDESSSTSFSRKILLDYTQKRGEGKRIENRAVVVQDRNISNIASRRFRPNLPMEICISMKEMRNEGDRSIT
jgi:hypothetical protein